MTAFADDTANHAAALRDLAPHGVDLHFSLIATRKSVAIKWHRSPYRRFVGTVKYGGLDMERRPVFWGAARFELLAREFVDQARVIRSSVMVGLKVESLSVGMRGRAAQMLARRRVVRTSAAHRLR